MGTFLKVLGGVVGVAALVVVGGGAWAVSSSNGLRARTFTIPDYEPQVPFALSEAEIAELREGRLADWRAAQEAAGVVLTDDVPVPDVLADVDLNAIALERAIQRGSHMVRARYACLECHGQNFGGGTMIDDPMIGVIKGPNLTTGAGGIGAELTAKDYNRILRHGVLRDGHPALMPCEDFDEMSDREMSDIISYIRSVPPVDSEVPPPAFGPLLHVLAATGQFIYAADVIHHDRVPLIEPPPASDTLAFGRHVTATCTGCHGASLRGGPIPGAPPDWAPAANITHGETGFGTWTLEQFTTLMRTGVRPDGTAVKMPMTLILPYMNNATDEEIAAIWTYLQSVPPEGATE